jgi:hypothetical protein
MCQPDISNVSDDQIQLHPALGIVITLDTGVQVAYPVYPPVFVEKCTFLIEKDKFNLTFKYCYGTILYILGEPTLFKLVGEYEWVSMDRYKCKP